MSLLSEALPDLAGMFTEVNLRNAKAGLSTTARCLPTPLSSQRRWKIDITQLSADERAVYLAIVKRYVALFLPEKRYLSAEVSFGVNGHTFVAFHQATQPAGWRRSLKKT
ncbi:hypothetical protein [Pseudomonas syringae group genomosp. 7]|uniref:hypothetical protein n=1 Tax=Pseudomonas syringae group genomosp. 7 TaxID=251699 RepID=UPI001F4BD107|nr:hypothetical protein [Pseudomonas syringae group genomosp. 7]UNB66153.1 hypothetical protein MME54_28490 [Pseudomonas syringae pv. helianthi]